MRPTLFGGPSFALHTYGVLAALGFAVGIVLFWREGQRQGLNGGRLLDLAFWCIVAGLVGSRLTYVALNAHDFANACFGSGVSADGRVVGCAAALRFWEGGFVFYGGAICAALVVSWFCRREGWSFWRLGDLAAPALAIGHALGRLGCFAAGCCFGAVCHAPWAAHFPAGSVAYQELTAVGVVRDGASTTPGLHPTQLYEALGELVLFTVLLLLRRRWREPTDGTSPASRAPGNLLLIYAGGYALLRFVVEIFRGDGARRHVFQWIAPGVARALGLPGDTPLLLSVSQLVSVLVLVAVGVALALRGRSPAGAALTAPGLRR